MQISLKFPETFFSALPVLINDSKGNIFYFHPNKQKKITFNLPSGEYESTNPITSLNIFIPYDLLPIPIKKEIPVNFEIFTGDNKNKATVYVKARKILIDKKIAALKFEPAKIFVICHEMGHNLFADENLCDVFAFNAMLLSGYNPMQVVFSVQLLFNKNLMRKDCFMKIVKEKNFRR